MSAALDARQAGARVEEVLEGLASDGDRRACAAAEELVRVLMDFYGAGLARIVERLGGQALSPVLDDELVASLLSLHDLHPEEVETRIGRALGAAGDTVERVAFDGATGVLRVRPRAAASGCGCGSPEDSARSLEEALACFAPEVTAVETEAAPAPQQPLLQISVRPHAPVRVP
ncbi:hypothetical protein ACFXPI_24730 [Streptomyces sp. NPDC059104]|uniref:hypothetical protein n=1 Tax=Streptomyces sp. NPDC059104 TaxID=3346729 RepID=UPI0036C34A93